MVQTRQIIIFLLQFCIKFLQLLQLFTNIIIFRLRYHTIISLNLNTNSFFPYFIFQLFSCLKLTMLDHFLHILIKNLHLLLPLLNSSDQILISQTRWLHIHYIRVFSAHDLINLHQSFLNRLAISKPKLLIFSLSLALNFLIKLIIKHKLIVFSKLFLGKPRVNLIKEIFFHVYDS